MSSTFENTLKLIVFLFFTGLNILQFLWTESHFKIPPIIYLSFLTYHSLIHNTIYYFYMLMKSILFPRKEFHFERIYMKFIFCISFAVLCVYWANEFTDTEYLVPKKRDIPFLLDFLTHGFNFIMNLITMIFLQKKDHENKLHVGHITAYFTVYCFYIKYMFRSVGFAPYIFVGFSTDYFEKTFVIMYSIALLMFVIGEFFYKFINSFKAARVEQIKQN